MVFDHSAMMNSEDLTMALTVGMNVDIKASSNSAKVVLLNVRHLVHPIR